MAGLSSPRTHLPRRALRSLLGPEPPGQAKSGVRRPARLAPESLSGFLRPRARWPRQRIQMRPLLRVRRSASGRGQSRTGWGRRHGGCRPSPEGPTRLPRRRPGPASRGACACLPPLPTRSGPPHPTAGFVRQPRGGPSPFPSAPPRPLRWPHFLGAGGGSGTGTKGLTRGSSRRGGIRSRAERGAEAASAKKMSA